MKKIFNFVFGVIITAYILMAVVLTGCLLLYNDYKVTEINGKSLIIIDDNELKPYKKGDLVIAEKPNVEDIKIGDDILFYSEDYGVVSVNQGKVIEYVTEGNKIEGFSVGNGKVISASSVVGEAKDVKIVEDLGSILSVLESRFGFLFIVIMPVLVIFLYVVYRFIIELKTPIEDDEDDLVEEEVKKAEKISNDNKNYSLNDDTSGVEEL